MHLEPTNSLISLVTLRFGIELTQRAVREPLLSMQEMRSIRLMGLARSNNGDVRRAMINISKDFHMLE